MGKVNFTFVFTFDFAFPCRPARPHPGWVPPGVKRVARGWGSQWGESEAMNPAVDWVLRLG